MGLYLNSIAPYMNYQEATNDPYYVDKTEMIKILSLPLEPPENIFV